MKKSSGRSATNTAKLLERMFLGALQAARGLRNPAEAKAAEKAWLDLGRKQGLDTEKVLKLLERRSAQRRQENGLGFLPVVDEGSTTRSTSVASQSSSKPEANPPNP
ncbi:MAG: hypothetical protein GXY19_10420 [Phycisphaerae bacterium]|nr:hypothetical protein [Phycisphaerae bacterium]